MKFHFNSCYTLHEIEWILYHLPVMSKTVTSLLKHVKVELITYNMINYGIFFIQVSSGSAEESKHRITGWGRSLSFCSRNKKSRSQANVRRCQGMNLPYLHSSPKEVHMKIIPISWPGITGRTEWNQCALLWEKSVV